MEQSEADQLERKLSLNSGKTEESVYDKSSAQNKELSRKKVGAYTMSLNQVLGKGSFSTVYFGTRKDWPEKDAWRRDYPKENKYAIKEIPNSILQQKLGEKGKEALSKEINISSLLKHQNIVRLYDTLKTHSNNYLMFEYCGGGDLREYIKSLPQRRVTEIVAQRFMYQIGQALIYLQKNNILHRDLKLQNILMTEKSDKAILKLADFGLAKRQESKEDLFETICGTPIYMAPELQRNENYTDKADLWSLGVILFEMIAGMPPFPASNREQLKKAIERGVIRFPEDVQLSQFCKHLICSLLIQDAKDRLEWTKFFEHPFMKTEPSEFARLYGLTIFIRFKYQQAQDYCNQLTFCI